MKTIAIEEIAPYMDDRPITEEVLKEKKFKKVRVSEEESGDMEYEYYVYNAFPDEKYNDLSLLATQEEAGKYIVKLFPYENPVFKTAGGIAIAQMALLGE